MALFDEFLSHFEELKSRLKGSLAQDLVSRANSEPDLAELACDLWIDGFFIESEMKHQPGKVHRRCPNAFPAAFREYGEKFKEYVERAAAPIVQKRSNEWANELVARLIAEQDAVGSADNNDELDDEPFNIDAYDGGKLIDQTLDEALFFVQNYEDDSYFDEKLSSAEEGRKAWRYLHNTIGVNISDVFRRWKFVRPFFVPSNVANHHGLTEQNSLYAKLIDAVRAYSVGCFLASMAVCRSVLETTLRRHYLSSSRMAHEKVDLEVLIDASTLNAIDKKRFQELRKFTNRVLHQDGALPGDAEAQVSTFLFALKRLIEEAPVRAAQ